MGAEQEQEIQRWSVIQGEIENGGMAKLEEREWISKKVSEEKEGGEQDGENGESMLVFNGG